jgi:hypothetical protein
MPSGITSRLEVTDQSVDKQSKKKAKKEQRKKKAEPVVETSLPRHHETKHGLQLL